MVEMTPRMMAVVITAHAIDDLVHKVEHDMRDAAKLAAPHEHLSPEGKQHFDDQVARYREIIVELRRLKYTLLSGIKWDGS